MTTFLIREWPHTRSHGERWASFPLSCPPDQPWPGLQFFATETQAQAR